MGITIVDRVTLDKQTRGCCQSFLNIVSNFSFKDISIVKEFNERKKSSNSVLIFFVFDPSSRH